MQVAMVVVKSEPVFALEQEEMTIDKKPLIDFKVSEFLPFYFLFLNFIIFFNSYALDLGFEVFSSRSFVASLVVYPFIHLAKVTQIYLSSTR